MAVIPPQSAITPEVVELICQSLRVNPSWGAAADYAGISDRTLRLARQRAEAFAKRYEGDEEVTDLAAARLYKQGRDAWEAGDMTGAQRAIEAIWRHVDRDQDGGYYEAVSKMTQSRARGELQLVAIIRKAAGEGDWRAAYQLLKAGWPDRYNDRLEITGAKGGPVEVEHRLKDAEDRARQALDAWAERDRKLEAG